MKTFELTFSITTADGSDIDMEAVEDILSNYGNTDLEFVDLDMTEPDTAMAVFSLKANSLRDCPDELELLNDEDFVDDVNFYETERVSHTSY